MTTPSWSLQNAKNRFSSLVDAALAGEPQWVTRHGKPAVAAAETRPRGKFAARNVRHFEATGVQVENPFR